MRRACATVVHATVLWTIGLATLLAQAQAPLHDSQYPDADIAYGAAVYASKCVTCHGTQGDGIGGVNLTSGDNLMSRRATIIAPLSNDRRPLVLVLGYHGGRLQNSASRLK